MKVYLMNDKTGLSKVTFSYNESIGDPTYILKLYVRNYRSHKEYINIFMNLSPRYEKVKFVVDLRFVNTPTGDARAGKTLEQAINSFPKETVQDIYPIIMRGIDKCKKEIAEALL